MRIAKQHAGLIVTTIDVHVSGILERQFMVLETKPSGRPKCVGRIGLLMDLKCVGSFRQLFVRPSCRGRGIGTLLVALVARAASERGHCAINCEIDADNQSVIKFYHKMGFQIVAEYAEGSMIMCLNFPSEEQFELLSELDESEATLDHLV